MNMQNVNTESGQLQIRVTSRFDAIPVEGARIRISYPGDPDSTLEELITNSSGMTNMIELNAPPADFSLTPDNTNQPYSIYTLEITAAGFESIVINGAQILAAVKAIQEVQLTPEQQGRGEYYVIPDHALYSVCPSKIAEDEIKPVNEGGDIVLRHLVIPEFIVVHDGSPNDKSAQNHYIRYRDYIKNVASNEIYATWPADTLRANILAIMSFTLNRVYTDHYRNKGYDFTITSSSEHDQIWIPNRNVYDTISDTVDELFLNYLSRPNVRQPILTQYCDGQRVSCPNWMTGLQGR